jgi:hypothetical protein
MSKRLAAGGPTKADYRAACELALMELIQVTWSGLDSRNHTVCCDCWHMPPTHEPGCEMESTIRVLRRLLNHPAIDD